MSKTGSRAAWLSGAALLLCSACTWAAEIDADASHASFTLETRWGQTLEGEFPGIVGEVEALPDGRHQVRMQLRTTDVEIVGHPGYTRFARGGGFFDAEHWPTVAFVSDPYPIALLKHGGALTGRLEIRGISHHETFTILAAACDAPGRECDVVASGTIRRSDYGMDRWRIAIRERVQLFLRIRMRGEGAA